MSTFDPVPESVDVAAAPPRSKLDSRYWRLWVASTISNVGDGVDVAALPLMAATITKDPRLVAGLAVALTLPWLFFALPAGAIVDRLDRRKVMYRVDLVRAALVAVIAVLVVTDTTTIWALYLIALALGVCETLFDNAAQSILPSIVEPHLLEVANGRLYAAETVANTFVGPPIGGALFAVAASAPFWIDSGSFVLAAVLILSIRGHFRPTRAVNSATPTVKRTLRADIAEGVRWLRRHRLLRTLALLLGAANFASMLGNATVVLFAEEVLGLGAAGYGLLLAGMAVGSVIGALVAPRIIRALGPGRSLVVSFAAIGFPEAAVGLASNAVVVAALLSFAGVFISVWNIITVSLRQQIVPDALLGRVNSVYRTLGWGSMPLGALAGGLLANAFGLRAPWVIGGAITAIALLLGYRNITTAAVEQAKAEAARA